MTETPKKLPRPQLAHLVADTTYGYNEHPAENSLCKYLQFFATSNSSILLRKKDDIMAYPISLSALCGHFRITL